ncbi:PrsW family intramembrane metalloprotease [Xylophilus sp. GOD-11R]|uniref:PrsW family intramembrane metalloprotease n=1 Tax=Xylophilus sp. GOD-11R TaxID=3089814 RepID=UPI00298D531F|nr:PrsW family glutamic-type intramembrane protease [Xylophilus sp. GOD-11R]WPB55044.1 PrsW family glutamic-type intramembrane protease [Xylophilus sp. GOD-11R]
MSTPAFDTAPDWPVGTDSFVQPRRAAFWVLIALIVIGFVYTARMFTMGARVVPVTVALGVVVWAAYAWLFVLAFRLLDLLEEHPPEAFVLAFGWGGLGAVFFAVPANVAFQSLCAKLISPEFVATWGPAVAGPTSEEFLKVAGVVLLILVARASFQTYLSVLSIGAMVGLGFQVVENLSDTVQLAMHFPSESQVRPVLLNLLMRGLLSGLWTHAAYTTVASFGIAWYLLNPGRSRWQRLGMVAACLALAWGMHFVWNSPLLEDRFDDSLLGTAELLVAKGVPVMIAAALIWRVATRESGAWLHALAAYFVPERELIADDEWMRLGAPLQRLRAVREVRLAQGRRAGRQKRRMQREQLRLVRQAAAHGRGLQTLRHERAIRRLRALLGRAGR